MNSSRSVKLETVLYRPLNRRIDVAPLEKSIFRKIDIDGISIIPTELEFLDGD